MLASLCFNYLFLLKLFASLIHYSEETKELILANVVFRHGDRSPYMTYANDPYKTFWPQGLGQLTKVGKQQAFHLGEILHSRYKGKLLNETYIENEQSALSASLDRTMMSAYCVLAALFYPTTDEEIWNPDIHWQPVTVLSLPVKDDTMLDVSTSKCSKAQKLYDSYMDSKELKEIIEQNQEFFDFLSQPNITGERIDLAQIEKVSDPLFCERLHGLTLPQWALLHWKNENQTIYDKLLQFLPFYMKSTFANPLQARYLSGPLLQNMVKNMQQKINGDIKEKLVLYSARDTTLVGILTLLGAFNNQLPPYASAVLLELYRENGTYYVSLHYRNNTDTDEIVNLQLPMCQSPCLWSSFVEGTKNLYPSDWESECNQNQKSIGKIIVIVIIVVGCAILVITVLIVCLKQWYDKRGRNEYSTMNND